jgi:hypothetical protein
VEGSCEHGDELSCSIKYWEVLEWLHNWQLLKEGSAPYVSKEVLYGEVNPQLGSPTACLNRIDGKQLEFHFSGKRKMLTL